jgi:hypothetical protein
MQTTISNAKEIQFIATVIRADGRVENLGVIDYWHKNPIKRFIWKLKKFLERIQNGNSIS